VLGRSLGLTEQQLSHLTDDPLPEGVYTPAEAAIVRYAQKSTKLDPIDDRLYGDLARHFSTQQLIDICLTVGLSNMVNRFHATFGTDLDDATIAAAEAGDALHGACPLRRPKPPT
jgi:alkylhydroperoxidase family enzyme